MTGHIQVDFSAIGGTAAGLGRTPSGHSVIADRPAGKAGGQGLGCNGGELLAAALGGCFWNDLHYAADALGAEVTVKDVSVDVALSGTPARVVSAHIRARLAGTDDRALTEIFNRATHDSTIANSLMNAIAITFERRPEQSP